MGVLGYHMIIVSRTVNDHPLDLVKIEVFELSVLNHNRSLEADRPSWNGVPE